MEFHKGNNICILSDECLFVKYTLNCHSCIHRSLSFVCIKILFFFPNEIDTCLFLLKKQLALAPPRSVSYFLWESEVYVKYKKPAKRAAEVFRCRRSGLIKGIALLLRRQASISDGRLWALLDARRPSFYSTTLHWPVNGPLGRSLASAA